jgi:hypothetical protein
MNVREKKDITAELRKVANLFKTKVEKEGTCPPSVFSYSLETGNNFVQLPEWDSTEERNGILTNMVDWLKEQHSYGFIFASPATRYKYNTPEDFKNDVNAIKVPEIILVAKTPEKTINMAIEYEIHDGKFTFKDELADVTNDESRSFLDQVYINLQ